MLQLGVLFSCCCRHLHFAACVLINERGLGEGRVCFWGIAAMTATSIGPMSNGPILLRAVIPSACLVSMPHTISSVSTCSITASSLHESSMPFQACDLTASVRCGWCMSGHQPAVKAAKQSVPFAWPPPLPVAFH